MRTHERDRRIIAEEYGYHPEQLTGSEERQVMASLYLWRKAGIENPLTITICLTKGSWDRLEAYCQACHLTILELSIPLD